MRRLHFLYHELRGEGSDYAYVVKTSEFARQMELFERLHTNADTALRPEVTFDDGHVSNYEEALPILQAHGLKARFFITVGWTGQRTGYMGWQQLRALHATGQEIGAHGWTHTLLTHCDSAQLSLELRDARLKLEDGLGAGVPTMSLPGGRYNKRVLEACKEAGYRQIFTSVPQASEGDAWMVGRLNVVGGMGVDWMERVLDPATGVLAGLARKDKLKGVAKSVLGDSLYARLWGLVNRSEGEAGSDQAGEGA
jgi:peptidoglycan/xylan/chitin deacetylase (PgdA/CDA1 family)